mgnify:CR=1 FL=1
MSSEPWPHCPVCDSNSLFEFVDRIECLACGAKYIEALLSEYPEEDEHGG